MRSCEEPLVCHGGCSRWGRFPLSAAGAGGKFPPDEWTFVLQHMGVCPLLILCQPEEPLTSRKV